MVCRTSQYQKTYRARTDIPNFPTLHNIIQRLHNLLLRRLPIHPMDLQHIDIRPQPLHARLHSVENMLPR